MNKIKILDLDTIEKIAAGEVVERPYSAVKELVENAIDAKADKITIDLGEDVTDFIKISDNGVGMNHEDLKLCLLPHTTSKIQNINDLEKIKTFGFRGEALSTIARISKLEIKTKQAESELGFSLVSEGGEIKQITKAGLTTGTQITINDLFYNTPARKKFLKSSATEISHIISNLEKIAISHPEISFHMNVKSKPKLNLYKTDESKRRILDIFGDEISNFLIPLNFENNFVKISGFVSSPDWIEKSKNKYFTFVNRRSIISKILISAINESYKEHVLKSRFPVIFLFLELSGEFFDVNVHPQKIDVKFVNERAIFCIVKDLISLALQNKNNEKILNYEEQKKANLENFGDKNLKFEEKNVLKFDKNIYKKNSAPSYTKVFIPENYKKNFLNAFEKIHSTQKITEISAKTPDEKNFNKNISPSQTESIFPIQNDIKVIGWLPEKFILAFNSRKDLLIFDQHACHERVNYEILRNDFESKRVEVQGLLIPTVVNILASKIDIVLKNLKNFETFGFFVEHFGDRTLKITAVPSIIQNGNEKAALLEIIENLTEKDILSSEEIIDKIIRIACKNSIKANQILSFPEMQKLIERLFQTKNPYNCPHGRPTIISFSENEIDTKFGRKNV